MRSNAPLCSAVAIACLLSAGCGDQPPAPQGVAAPHTVVAFPNSVQLAAGASAQVQAQVNDEHEQPIGGAAIVFRSKDPDVIGVTQDGVVSALGPVGVSAVQIASGVRLVEVPVRIIAGAGALLEATRAPPDTAQAGGLIGDITAQVRDQFNNPVPGATLSWVVGELGGSIESATTITGADGTGSARWIAGTTTGPQTLEVQSGDLPPLVLTTLVSAGPPSTIKLLTDPSLQPGKPANVDDELQIQVQVVDQHGNGVNGVEIALSGSGACKADPILQKTDVVGTTPASDWRMAAGGTCTVSAKVGGQPALEARLTLPVKAAAKRGRR